MRGVLATLGVSTCMLISAALQQATGVAITGIGLSTATASAPPATGIIFNPVAGSYVGTQHIAITYPTISSDAIFYTTDGAPTTIASTLLGSGATFPLSATTTVNAQAANIQNTIQAINSSSSGWKTATVNGGNCTPANCPVSKTGGGIGCNQPFSWYWTFGTAPNSPMVETFTSPSSRTSGCGSNATQILWIQSGPSSNNATMVAQHKWVQPSVSGNVIQNNEMDIEQTDTVHTVFNSCTGSIQINSFTYSGGVLTLSTNTQSYTAGNTVEIDAPSGDGLHAINGNTYTVLSSPTSTSFRITESTITSSGTSANGTSSKYTNCVVNHNVGLQCNQQGTSGNPTKTQWQVAGLGSWVNTGIHAGCSWTSSTNNGMVTTSYTSVDYSAHWTLSDTGCGGAGCIYLDYLIVVTGCSLSTQTCTGTPSVNFLGGTQWYSGLPLGAVAARPENGWAAGCGNQDQIDLTTLNTTAGRNVAFENVTCALSTDDTGTATYSF